MREEKSVLIIEDDVDLSQTIAASLNRIGYGSMVCNTLRDAILRMKNQSFDCILLDINLGMDNGEDIVNLVRERKDMMNLETPIMLISENLDKELVTRLAKHIHGALVKPFDLKTLHEAVVKMAGPART